MIRKIHHGPVYREVLSHAIRTAWQDKRYWVLSIFAGFLVSAGAYDVLWKSVNSFSMEYGAVNIGAGKAFLNAIQTSASGFHSIISIIGGIETLLLLALILVFFIALSCVSQGGLIYAMGARKRGQKPELNEAFKVGAGAFWPILVLNVLVLAVLWILRFIVTLPLYLAIEQTTSAAYTVYLVSFIIFIPLVFLIAIVQIFALNALILQGAPLAAAIERGYKLFTKHWVVIIETAVIQALLSIGIWILFMFGYLFLMIPVLVFFIAAAIIQSSTLFAISVIIGLVIFFLGTLAAAAFTIQLQYATWTYLYRKLGEGGVVPKLHRIIRNATGFFKINS
ncbi:MAG: hypothetical protein ABII13_00565 [Patescibacteria group bacterium]|nr:hypothetical protein [Patescibacteria group bacterium]MBU2508952.1 hypothetical protein [Patescibacteria group bacterium]